MSAPDAAGPAPGRAGRLVKAIVLGCVIFYSVKVALLYAFQRQIIYKPDAAVLGGPADSGVKMQPVTVTTADGLTLRAWFAPPAARGGRVVVFFHGNAGTIAGRAVVKFPVFRQHGYGMFLCEYRGYGGNAGDPSEQGFYADGRAALEWLEKHGYTPVKLVYYGESIGSGVAVEMALEKQPSALVLEAPFSSMVELGQHEFPTIPMDILLKDRFDNIGKIGRIHTPLLIAHGDADRLIPIALARRLFAAAKLPKDFFEIHGGGHNDLYNFQAGDKIAAWLDSTGTGEVRK